MIRKCTKCLQQQSMILMKVLMATNWIKKIRKKEKRKLHNQKKKIKKNKKTEKNNLLNDEESEGENDSIDDYDNDDDEIIEGAFVTVPFEATKECKDLPKVNQRVAFKFIVNGIGDGEYFSGTVLQVAKRYTCKKFGKEEFVPTLRVLFDGLDENPAGEVVDFDDDLRLL